MDACEDREAGSVHQKKLAFQFCAPHLDYSKDKSNARIFWQARGALVASYKDHMVKSVGTGDKTYVVSSWMGSEEAQRKLERTLAALREGTSWVNMYEILAEACQDVHLLPHKFVMPRVESHPAQSNLARISWMQRGKVVEQHSKDLKQYNKKNKQTFY